MADEWRTAKLREVLGPSGYIRGPFGSALRRPELKSKGIPVYEQQHAITGTRDFRFFIDDDKYAKLRRFTVQENDLIISCSGTLARVSMIRRSDPKGIISQALLILRPDTSVVDPKYLYCFLSSTRGFNSLVEVSTGSVQVNIARRSIIENTDLPLPPLKQQQAIACILGALDDKIELNRKMNRTLEAMAQAIFKSWFVDFDPIRAKAAGRNPGLPKRIADLFPDSFEDSELGEIPKGWEVGSIDDEFDLTMGQSPPGETYNEVGEGLPFYQGRADFSFRFPTRRVYCTAPTRFAKAGDTLVSVRAPVGDVNMASEDCAIGRGVAAARHKAASRSYSYQFMQSIEEVFARFEAEGTVFGSIGKSDFHAIPCVRPPRELVLAYEARVSPFDDRIEVNELESRTLVTLRDTLLPKLISGELQVKEAARFIERCL
jgi:type I restriction enzyme S subunit